MYKWMEKNPNCKLNNNNNDNDEDNDDNDNDNEILRRNCCMKL